MLGEINEFLKDLKITNVDFTEQKFHTKVEFRRRSEPSLLGVFYNSRDFVTVIKPVERNSEDSYCKIGELSSILFEDTKHRDFRQLKKIADELRGNEKDEHAVIYYRDYFENHRQLRDLWIGWGYAYTLLKLEKYGDALEVSREVYGMNAEFDAGKNVYAGYIYHGEIKKDMKLFKPNDKYSSCTITVLRVLD